MRSAGAFLGVIAAAAPATAMACSCGHPDEMTIGQLQYMMRDLSVVGYGRVYGTVYPAACRIAPLRWVHAAMGWRAPVTYKLALRKIVWGRSPRKVDVVQDQHVGWSRCDPLGSAACQPTLPAGDALWPLERSSKGDFTYAGRCGLMIAEYVLRRYRRTDASNVR